MAHHVSSSGILASYWQWQFGLTTHNSSVIKISFCKSCWQLLKILQDTQRAKKVVSDGQELVDFAIGLMQGSKLTLANSQNASDFDNLRVRKISTSKRLRVRIIHVSQTKGNNLLVVSPVCQRRKILLAKLCKCTKKITSSPVMVFVVNLPDRQVLFLGEIQITEGL